MLRTTLAILVLFTFSLFGSTLQAQAQECRTWQVKCHGDGDTHLSCADGKIAHKGEGDSWSFYFDEGDAPFIGVTLAELDPDTASDAGLSKDGGILISSVYDDTPAQKAGLEAGDVITEFAGHKIDNVEYFMELVLDQKIGEKVKIKCRRDGKNKSFKVKLAKRDKSFFLKGNLPRGLPRLHSFKLPRLDHHRLPHLNRMFAGGKFSGNSNPARLGVEVRELDDDLAAYFPGTDGAGVLVLGITEDSPAADLELRAGDVITELGGRATDTPNQLRKAVAAVAGEGEVKIHLLRQGKKRKQRVEIPTGEDGPAYHHFSDDDHEWLQLDKFLGSHHDDDLREKLQQLEEKLEALEEKLK